MHYILIILGVVFLILWLKTMIGNILIKKNGILTNARVVSYEREIRKDTEAGNYGEVEVKFPILTFEYLDNGITKNIRIKGKSNSKFKIGEITPVYYDPNNPEGRFYLPKKDFLVKYLFLIFGIMFLYFGINGL
ncbi:DUF3592 domain-containing protein [Tenacibaculum aiptasiae]|uniref:DUF3592 domain-containing protein n=1 Tax=Tenacibaculum aiptasiae TaxID=426481 RepID=A0A7J5AQ60_9FLAO|nr:DUF3592 domain-containing protein [Tenacibaculum aiptasiae]KAB1159746.1 DUF3592 domain-containing protein [Tenacibaculum aiptasiae]